MPPTTRRSARPCRGLSTDTRLYPATRKGRDRLQTPRPTPDRANTPRLSKGEDRLAFAASVNQYPSLGGGGKMQG